MADAIKFSGSSTLKGRNGYTSLGSADSFTHNTYQDGKRIQLGRYINFYSSRPRGGVGTALMDLNREDFLAFQAWIAQMTWEDTRSEREIEIGSIAYAEEQRSQL